MSQFQGVDDVVMVTSRDLQQTHKPLKRPVGMVLYTQRERERERERERRENRKGEWTLKFSTCDIFITSRCGSFGTVFK